ncbi:hypothetical protein HPB50_004732 [Hyalomma asiaticum]|uniref:Uncharacterized protein n=1 Tax=Hyalomma asiaticum TaxID=266040 RepID=A0ACB7SRX9_HYAAI|nr:hypothetical protein HPB50_004732 [Hyalomma asiaticum]
MLLSLGILLLVASAALATEYKKCPDGNLCHKNGTCCLLPVGRYSCCTLTNAVCCTARSSCCPEHYVCDTASNLCAPAAVARKHPETRKPTEATTAATATTAFAVDSEEWLMAKCPAGDTYCFRDNSTCCRQESGSYGCCPDKDAVCCSDLVNCCPRGFACIRGTGNCVQTASIARVGAGARRTALRAELAGSDMTEPLAVAAMRLERGRVLP